MWERKVSFGEYYVPQQVVIEFTWFTDGSKNHVIL
jgi:hypothetical protein